MVGLPAVFNRGTPKLTTGEKMAYSHGLVVADSGRTQSELEQIRELGINRLMIDDDKLDQFLESFSIKIAYIPDPKDPKGKKMVPVKIPVHKWAAVFMARSSLIRTSYVDNIDAQIGMIRSRRLLRKVKMTLSEEEYEEGAALLLEAVGMICDTAWCDAIDGRKAKLMKVNPKTFEIQWKGEQKKGSSGGYLG
jgi:hypothetical protein